MTAIPRAALLLLLLPFVPVAFGRGDRAPLVPLLCAVLRASLCLVYDLFVLVVPFSEVSIGGGGGEPFILFIRLLIPLTGAFTDIPLVFAFVETGDLPGVL